MRFSVILPVAAFAATTTPKTYNTRDGYAVNTDKQAEKDQVDADMYTVRKFLRDNRAILKDWADATDIGGYVHHVCTSAPPVTDTRTGAPANCEDIFNHNLAPAVNNAHVVELVSVLKAAVAREIDYHKIAEGLKKREDLKNVEDIETVIRVKGNSCTHACEYIQQKDIDEKIKEIKNTKLVQKLLADSHTNVVPNLSAEERRSWEDALEKEPANIDTELKKLVTDLIQKFPVHEIVKLARAELAELSSKRQKAEAALSDELTALEKKVNAQADLLKQLQKQVPAAAAPVAPVATAAPAPPAPPAPVAENTGTKKEEKKDESKSDAKKEDEEESEDKEEGLKTWQIGLIVFAVVAVIGGAGFFIYRRN